ncbi:MAG: SGNH/GDSL hydrolase family protein [Planctomycetota bacterium]|nr:MAG: SGNH/GDSL hydrolase family protein [Planctomycetota bacterium]
MRADSWRALVAGALAAAGYALQAHPGLLGGVALALCAGLAIALLARGGRAAAWAAAAPALFLVAFTARYAVNPAVRSPLYSLGLLAACAAALAIALVAAATTSRTARVALRAALLAASACASVAVAELAWRRLEAENPYELRAIEGSTVRDCLRPDPRLGIAPQPGFRGRFAHPEYHGELVEIGAQGFRGAAWDELGPATATGRPRVLLLGDSTVFGFGAEDAQTVAAQLAHSLAEPDGSGPLVLAAAVPGYGPRHHRLLLERLLPLVRPVAVVAFFYDVNDLDDSLQQFRLARECGDHARTLASESAAASGAFRAPSLYASIRSTLPLYGRAYWVRYSSYCRALDFRFSGWLARAGFASLQLVYNHEFLRAMARAPDLEVRDELELVDEAYEAQRALCAAAGVRFELVRLPGKLQCEPSSFRAALEHLSQDPQAFDRTQPGREVLARAAARGIATLDLLPELELPDGAQSALYYREGHPNPAGNAWIAARVAERLRRAR